MSSKNVGLKLKNALIRSMDAVSRTASNIASDTRFKVEEMNLVNRRREILSSFSSMAYELWQKGEKLPEALDSMLQELSTVDERLNTIRAERVSNVKAREIPDVPAEAADPDDEAEIVWDENGEYVESMGDVSDEAYDAADADPDTIPVDDDEVLPEGTEADTEKAEAELL